MSYLHLPRTTLCAVALALVTLGVGCANSAEDIGSGSAAVEHTTVSEADLKAAVKGTDIKPLTDYGRSIGLSNYPKGTKLEAILADVTGWNEEDINLGGDDFDQAEGAKAAEGMAADFEGAASEERENGEDDDLVAAKALDEIAKATRGFFLPATKFAELKYASHSIAEDGDLESHTLVAKKDDGSFLVLSYTNFPF